MSGKASQIQLVSRSCWCSMPWTMAKVREPHPARTHRGLGQEWLLMLGGLCGGSCGVFFQEVGVLLQVCAEQFGGHFEVEGEAVQIVAVPRCEVE